MRANMAVICGKNVVEVIALDFNNKKVYNKIHTAGENPDGAIFLQMALSDMKDTVYICNAYIQTINGKVEHYHISPTGSLIMSYIKQKPFSASDALKDYLSYAYHKIFLN